MSISDPDVLHNIERGGGGLGVNTYADILYLGGDLFVRSEIVYISYK